MKKVFAVISKLFAAISAMSQALVSPLVQVISAAVKGEPIGLGQLSFAFWRLIVWTAFLLCLTGNMGVPIVIAYLFLTDITILGFQTVFIAVQ